MAFIENGSNYLALLNLTTVTADEITSPYLTVDVLTVETELITPSINFSGTGFFATPIRQSLTGPNFLTYNTTTNECNFDFNDKIFCLFLSLTQKKLCENAQQQMA